MSLTPPSLRSGTVPAAVTMVVAGLLAMGSLPGCSTTSAANGVGPPALAGCPATVADANGSRCVEGQICSPTYSCGAIEATATCVCAAGQFVCTDVRGMPLHGGTAPSCPDAQASETCPATEMSASLAGCTEPGLTCNYPSTCHLRPLDTCQCVSSELDNGMTGLRFQCSDACNPVEAGLDGSDAQTDATDATPNDGEAGDASTIDADAAGTDGASVEGAAPSDSGAADVTEQ